MNIAVAGCLSASCITSVPSSSACTRVIAPPEPSLVKTSVEKWSVDTGVLTLSLDFRSSRTSIQCCCTRCKVAMCSERVRAQTVWYGATKGQHIFDNKINAHPGKVALSYKEKILCNAFFYKHQRIDENLQLERCCLKLPSDEKIFNVFNINSLLNVRSLLKSPIRSSLSMNMGPTCDQCV